MSFPADFGQGAIENVPSRLVACDQRLNTILRRCQSRGRCGLNAAEQADVDVVLQHIDQRDDFCSPGQSQRAIRPYYRFWRACKIPRQLLWLLLPVKADWTISIKPDRSISKIAGYDDPVFGGECYRILVEGQGATADVGLFG